MQHSVRITGKAPCTNLATKKAFYKQWLLLTSSLLSSLAPNSDLFYFPSKSLQVLCSNNSGGVCYAAMELGGRPRRSKNSNCRNWEVSVHSLGAGKQEG